MAVLCIWRCLSPAFSGHVRLDGRFRGQLPGIQIDRFGGDRIDQQSDPDQRVAAGFVRSAALRHGSPSFQARWTRIMPEPIERSTYVLVSCAVTFLLMWQWRGIDQVVWDAHHPMFRGLLWVLFAIGWLLVPLATLLINHFDLFGTRQVWLYLRGREYESLPFRVPSLYKHVRHPLYVGWAIAFWATPTMTAGHLLFAGVLTGYMGLAALLEEHDLIAHFGGQYEEYRRPSPCSFRGGKLSSRMWFREGAIPISCHSTPTVQRVIWNLRLNRGMLNYASPSGRLSRCSDTSNDTIWRETLCARGLASFANAWSWMDVATS